MLPEQFGYIAIITSSFGISFYVRDMLRGQTKPNLVSWFCWMLAPIIGGFLQLKAGAGLSVIGVFTAGLVCIPVLVIGILKKNAHWKVGIFDILCGVFSVCAVALWVITKNTDISLYKVRPCKD